VLTDWLPPALLAGVTVVALTHAELAYNQEIVALGLANFAGAMFSRCAEPMLSLRAGCCRAGRAAARRARLSSDYCPACPCAHLNTNTATRQPAASAAPPSTTPAAHARRSLAL
jgi:hypothetical protein